MSKFPLNLVTFRQNPFQFCYPTTEFMPLNIFMAIWIKFKTFLTYFFFGYLDCWYGRTRSSSSHPCQRHWVYGSNSKSNIKKNLFSFSIILPIFFQIRAVLKNAAMAFFVPVFFTFIYNRTVYDIMSKSIVIEDPNRRRRRPHQD